MGWSDWFSDDSGPGEVAEKVTSTDDGGTRTEYLRTEDYAKEGDRDDHSHIVVQTDSDGHTEWASGHGIYGGDRKDDE